MIDECKSIMWYRNDISSPSGRADNYNSSCSQTLSPCCADSLYSNSAEEQNHNYGFYTSCECRGSLCRFPADSRSAQLHSASLHTVWTWNCLHETCVYKEAVIMESKKEFNIFHLMWVVRRPNTGFMLLWHEERVRISWFVNTLHHSCVV